MIIDFHTHIFPPSFRQHRESLFPGEKAFQTLYQSPSARLAGARDLLRAMDEASVDRAVVFGFPWEDPERCRRHNDYILECVSACAGRLIGFACFSPLLSGSAREAERCMDQGLAGVGELAVYGSDLTGEVVDALHDVMTLCLERKAPFLLHVNEPVGHAYPGKTPNTLARIYGFLKAWPDNRIVLAHWGGGLPFYGLLKREVKEVFQNVWFDTAASPFLYLPAVYRIVSETAGDQKILFGSDFPLLKPQRYYQEMQQAGLSEEACKRIQGQNAADLLGLDGG